MVLSNFGGDDDSREPESTRKRPTFCGIQTSWTRTTGRVTESEKAGQNYIRQEQLAHFEPVRRWD